MLLTDDRVKENDAVFGANLIKVALLEQLVVLELLGVLYHVRIKKSVFLEQSKALVKSIAPIATTNIATIRPIKVQSSE